MARPMPTAAPLSLPARAADYAAEVATMEVRVVVSQHVGLDVAERSVRLVLYAVVESLDDVFLEMGRAGKGRDHGLAHGIRIFLVGDAEHVHRHSGGKQGYDRMHMLGDAGRGGERDRGPH